MAGLTLKSLQKVVQAAFDATGQVAQQCTYHSSAPVTALADYDIASGTVAPTQIDYILKQVVFVGFEQQEVDNDVAVLTDEKMLFPRSALPVAISPDDTVTDAQGRTWEVIREMRDPAGPTGVLGKIHVRTSR